MSSALKSGEVVVSLTIFILLFQGNTLELSVTSLVTYKLAALAMFLR